MVVGITGGAGYIGTVLTKKLLDEGYDVKGIDMNDGVRVHKGDMTNHLDVDRFVEDVDFIFHLASISNPRVIYDDIFEGLKQNVLSLRLILEAIKDKNIGLFFPSSVVAVCGDTGDLIITEEIVTNPITDYGILKRTAEMFCRSYYKRYGVPVVIGRQSTVYGPSPSMRTDSLIHASLDRVIKGEDLTIFGTGLQKRDFIFIDDLVEAYYLILKNHTRMAGETYNIVSGNIYTVSEVVDMVSKVATSTVSVVKKPIESEVPVTNLKIDTSKMNIAVGYRAGTHIKDGIKITYEHMIGGNSDEY